MTSFFSSWRFPTFAITAVIGYELALLALLLLPSGSEFAEEFRRSCFGYDPVTGLVSLIVVSTTLAVPLIVGLVASIVWKRELTAALRARRPAVAGYVGLGLAVAFGSVAALAVAGRSAVTDDPPFPTDALRTKFPAPDFELTDHTGSTVRLADLRGQVVLVTAFFARCGYSCPMLLSDLQKSVAALTPEQLDDLRVAVITLDPENDTPEVLAGIAAARGFTSPPFHLLTGEPATVGRILDDFAVPRLRDTDKGFIDHSNLIILIDREGLIAYRFTLEERHESWLGNALRLLLGEGNP
jgi:cytochrome oxidase Cu insertion factor (SCO1/SenC/PrrC family)